MKKKFILLPITLTALAPAISLVGCGDPDTPEPPEPEYEDINLSLEESCFYSDIRNFDINKKYHLCAKGVFWEGITLLGAESEYGTVIMNVDVNIEKLLVNNENFDYEIEHEHNIMYFELTGDDNDIDIYLIFNKTYNMRFRLFTF